MLRGVLGAKVTPHTQRGIPRIRREQIVECGTLCGRTGTGVRTQAVISIQHLLSIGWGQQGSNSTGSGLRTDIWFSQLELNERADLEASHLLYNRLQRVTILSDMMIMILPRCIATSKAKPQRVHQTHIVIAPPNGPDRGHVIDFNQCWKLLSVD